jgi:hypothetical protein
MIKAKAWTDCGQFKVEFDATKWAEQATEDAIQALAECEFSKDYAADDVAIFMADHDEKVAKMFEFMDVVRYQPLTGDTNGFECLVDSSDFFGWLEENKPSLFEEFARGER